MKDPYAPYLTQQQFPGGFAAAPLKTKPVANVWVAYAWWLIGILGFHKFYLGRFGMGFLYLCTGGLFGIGWFIDAFTLPHQVRVANGAALKPGVQRRRKKRGSSAGYLGAAAAAGLVAGATGRRAMPPKYVRRAARRMR